MEKKAMVRNNIKLKWMFIFIMGFLILGKKSVVFGAAQNDYLLPQSASAYLTEKDVAGFSKQKLNYARNEIFARHGRRFLSQELMDYFNSMDWYVGTIEPEEFDGTVLNDFEITNADFLSNLEYGDNPDGYILDQPGYDIYRVIVQMNETGAADSGVKVTEEQAWNAVYTYLDESIGMKTVYDYHGFLVSSDHTDSEYVFWFRSYTSAHAYYYVNKHTGDVYESQENPIVSIYGEKKYIFNIFGDEASHTETVAEYELIEEDGVYFTGMNSIYRGELTGSHEMIYATAYAYAYEGNIFFISGSMNLGEMDDSSQAILPKFDEAHVMFNKVRGFVCNEDTQFIAMSGEDRKDIYSPEGFVAFANKVKDSNLGLEIEVKNGIVESVRIES